MKFFVLFNFIINFLCVSCNSEDYDTDYSEGFISRWISYLKRLFLVVSILSGVILYYIPDSRFYARRGCCFLIDNFAEGLKTILCLKDDDFNKKNSGLEISISENFHDIDEFAFLNSIATIEDFQLNKEENQKNSSAIENAKELSIKYGEKEKNQKDFQRTKKENSFNQLILSSNLNQIANRNQILMNDKFSKSSSITDANWTSSPIRTTRQNKISQKNREKLSNFNTMENSINLKLDQNSNNLINKFDPRFSSFEKEILSKTDNLRQCQRDEEAKINEIEEIKIPKSKEILNNENKKKEKGRRRHNEENILENYETIPIFKNRINFSRTFAWIFGKCPNDNVSYANSKIEYDTE